MQFKPRLRDRGYQPPDNLIENTLSEIQFSERMSALQNKQKPRKRILPFVTEYRPSVPNLKKHSYEFRAFNRKSACTKRDL